MKVFRSIRRVFELILDAILPLRARAARTKARRPDEIPLSPSVHDLLGAKITTLVDYRDPAVRDLIQSLKYDGAAFSARLAATLLADYLAEELASERQFSTRRIVLVPVPLHRSRMRERGYNQIEIVLRALPEEFAGLVATDILDRTRATEPQTKLSRSARLSNVAGAFAIASEEPLAKTRVFLIDDVTTTGATLVNAAHPMRRAGAEVSLIALARA